MEKFVCKYCGKGFDTKQSLGGHANFCLMNPKNVNCICQYCGEKLDNSTKLVQHIRKCNKNPQNVSNIKLQQWIFEKHTCEKCGKVMTEKFHSGRFCSYSCANSHKHSEETKDKIRQSVKKTNKKKETKETLAKNYYKNPNKCIICGKILDYKHRYNKTCSKECLHIRLSQNANNRIQTGSITIGGVTSTSGNHGKQGNYKGIHCDSTYELAYVIYMLDHGYDIKRYIGSFDYLDNDGKLRKYYPDFIVNDTIVEIKGWWNNNVDIKAASNKIHILRVPAYSPYAVAEHAAAMLLTSVRRIHKAYIRTKDHNFSLAGLTGFAAWEVSKALTKAGWGKRL